MDKAERQRLKTLANDAVIATFGLDNQHAQLATALETCVDEIEDMQGKCSHCSICANHGDYEADDDDYADWEPDDDDEDEDE